MPIESAPIIFAASDLEFGCLCFLSLDWRGLLSTDSAMTTLDAWAWSEIATISQKSSGGFFGFRSSNAATACTVKLEMVSGRRKSIRLRYGDDLRRFFHAVARFTPTEKLNRPLWSVALHSGQRRALRLLHSNHSSSSSSSSPAVIVSHQGGRTTLEVPGDQKSGTSSQHWPVEEMNPRGTFIVRLPGTSKAPSYATLEMKKQEEVETSTEVSGITKHESGEESLSFPGTSAEVIAVRPPTPPPLPPPSFFQTPSYRPPLKKILVSTPKEPFAPLQANLLDELKSNFRSGIFIPPVRPKLPPAIALAAKKATLKKVVSLSSSALQRSPTSSSLEVTPISFSSSSSSASSTKSTSAKGKDEEEDKEKKEKTENGSDNGGGGGNTGMTLFEELKSFILYGRLRHVEPPRVNQSFQPSDFRFKFQLHHRMQSAPALLPSPYYLAPARPAARRPSQENAPQPDSSQHEKQQQVESDTHKNLPRPPLPPPPPPPQIIHYHLFSENHHGDAAIKDGKVDPDGNNNNGNAQFLACQLTPVPCPEHGTDLVVQRDPVSSARTIIAPEQTPYGLITGQRCSRRLSFETNETEVDEEEDDEDEDENGEGYMSLKSDISLKLSLS